MKKHKLIIIGVLGLLAWFALGPGFGQAQGPEILPVNASGVPIDPSPVTVSILDLNGNDITGAWLPVPNQDVIIRVNGAPGASFGLVPHGSEFLTTSAYPGECTNIGNPGDPAYDGIDFALVGDILTPKDCGGKAVIQVTLTSGDTHTFVIPQDDDHDGIATIYEAQYCPSGNCDPVEDNDIGPDADSPAGDGIAALDEYRGFRISGEYIRTNPMVKDFFVNLVTDQCLGTAGGDPVNLNIFFQYEPYEPDRLFANMNSLIPSMRIHRINNDEWVDKFGNYSTELGLVYIGSDADGVPDRQIAQNALAPLGGNPVKGVRVIECLDTVRGDPLGKAVKSPPDELPDVWEKEKGNAVIYTRRIWELYKKIFALGGERQLQYYTFENGVWTLKNTFAPPPPYGSPLADYQKNEGVMEIMRYAYSFYVAHEGAGHSLDLTTTEEGTNKIAYGYHHPPGTGTDLDQAITQKVDKKTTDYNKIYIPGSFGISDKRDMRILSSQ